MYQQTFHIAYVLLLLCIVLTTLINKQTIRALVYCKANRYAYNEDQTFESVRNVTSVQELCL